MQSYDQHERIMNPGAPTYLSIIDAVRAARKELGRHDVVKVIITKLDQGCADVKAYKGDGSLECEA